MAASSKLRIGIVGAGDIVKTRHLPGFTAIDGVEVVAVCNRSLESAETVARDWGIGHIHQDWRELVCRDDLDIIVIGTWPYLHRDITAAALAAGKHVFCQARMTVNYADARHMYELSQLSDRVTAICPPPHTMPVDRLVGKLLAEGFLGELRHVRLTSLSNAGADASKPAHWRQRKIYSGLNAMALGIWVEIIHKWVGWHEMVWAHNAVWVDRRPNEQGGTYEVSIPDSVTVLTQLANGAQGVYHLSTVAHHGGGDRIELYGSAGTIVHLPGSGELLAGRAEDGALQPLPVPDELANPWAVEENFIAAIRDGVPVQTSFHDGLKYMEFIEAVYRSHQTGSGIRLPLLG